MPPGSEYISAANKSKTLVKLLAYVLYGISLVNSMNDK